MSRKVKPGRWQQRDGGTAVVRSVKPLDPWPWKGTDSTNEANSWQNDGHCLTPNHPHDTDLVEYLGPEEQTGGEE